MYYISLKRSFYSTSDSLCCIKIHAEMTEKLQVKGRGFILTGAPVIHESLFNFFF